MVPAKGTNMILVTTIVSEELSFAIHEEIARRFHFHLVERTHGQRPRCP